MRIICEHPDITLNATRNNYPFGAGSGNAKLINSSYFLQEMNGKEISHVWSCTCTCAMVSVSPNTVAIGSNTFGRIFQTY
jgi:hypothetical protein